MTAMQRATARVRLAGVPVLVVGVVLAVLTAGCGGSGGSSSDPGKSAQSCRQKWKDLGHEVEGNAAKTNPSALADRWNTVSATIDYYVTSAGGKGCTEDLTRQKAAISALEAFSQKLAPYDVQLRLASIQGQAQAYALGPRPTPSTSPTPSTKPGKKHQKQKKATKPPLPPAPATIGLALKTLTAQAPVATEQQGPGWEEAGVAELTDTAAVAKTVRDLAFLSTQSPAYQTCTSLLALIDRALAAKGG